MEEWIKEIMHLCSQEAQTLVGETKLSWMKLLRRKKKSFSHSSVPGLKHQISVSEDSGYERKCG